MRQRAEIEAARDAAVTIYCELARELSQMDMPDDSAKWSMAAHYLGRIQVLRWALGEVGSIDQPLPPAMMRVKTWSATG